MLSPGQWHKRVPKSRRANLRFRLNLLRLCRTEPKYRAAVVEACRQDVLFYVNAFCWTFRPKAPGGQPKVVPFITWEGQDNIFLTLVDHIDRQRPLIGEKSRDAGWSWACCYTADWDWRFHKWSKIGLFSRAAELVDSKNPDALFWKVRFVQRHLPEWLWPRGWVKRLHDTQMYLENPETNSTITGQATTQDMGVAGRCSWALFDEFSRVPNAKTVLDSTKDTSDCRVFVSTHTGPGTTFHNLCDNGVTDKIVTHWTEHPQKRRGLYRYHPEGGRVEVLDKTFIYPPQCPTCAGLVDVGEGEPTPCHQVPARPFHFVMDGTPAGGPQRCVRSPWYDKECKERSKADVRTNLDIDVMGGTSQCFDQPTIRLLKATVARPPDWEGDLTVDRDTHRMVTMSRCPGGPLRLWCVLRPDGTPAPFLYAIGADIAVGTGATPSCASVGRVDTGEKVAQYLSRHVSPEVFAPIVAALGWFFAGPNREAALVAWEASGGVGEQFGTKFMGLGYPNVYYRETPMRFAGLRTTTDRPGWYTNKEEKKRLLLEYASALENRHFTNYCEEALEECLQFRWDGQGGMVHSAEVELADLADAGLNHGDMVIADALQWRASKRIGAGRPRQVELAEEPPPNSLAWRRKLWGRQKEASWI